MGVIQEKGLLHIESLTDEQLIAAYRESCPEAMDVLINRYKGLVRHRVTSHFFVGADKEDLVQEGMIGLFKAISDYQIGREASFKSFATLCITRQLSTAFKTATRQKHRALNTSISLNLPVGGDEEDTITLMDTLKDDENHNPERMMLDQEALEGLKRHMKEALSSFEWRVLTLHTEGQNYHEIAAQMGKTPKSIDNALQRIKRKLSQNYQ